MPAQCLNILEWRAATPKEMVESYDRPRPATPKPKRKAKKVAESGRQLIVRSQLKPVDVYAYLRARFGRPNGFQNFLRRDNSDNLIHWDFNLKAGTADVCISATSREVHFMLSESLADNEWRDLIVGLKADFPRLAADKAAMTHSFEKFVVFQNKFVALADVCADLHATIVDAPPIEATSLTTRTQRETRVHFRALKRNAARAESLYGPCVQLALLAPVMAEAFLNMFVLVFARAEIRDDKRKFDEFRRAKITERLHLLDSVCDGMEKGIDRQSSEYRNFLRIMNKRNFAIHGNVDPERERLDVVYFEGTRPLFTVPGDHLVRFFETLERLYNPRGVLEDYLGVHSFLHEITMCLTSRHRAFFEQVINDPYPGYEVRKKRITRILPDAVVMSVMEGMRYDDDLNVEWN